LQTPDNSFDMYVHLLQSYWSVACEGWYLKAAGLDIMMSCWVGEYLGLRGMNNGSQFLVYRECCVIILHRRDAQKIHRPRDHALIISNWLLYSIL